LVIEKLIEEHGPDCASPNHFLGVKDGKPVFTHEGSDEAKGVIAVCDVGKSGMRNGLTARLWDEMGDKLARAINERDGDVV